MPNISIRLDLKGEVADKFLELKRELGFKANTNVVIHLINDSYETAKKNPTKKEASS